MSDRAIRIPYRDRDDSLADVADAARALPASEDRTVVRGLVLAAAENGLSTAGDILDQLSDATPAERRAMLDDARQRAGLPTTGEVDARRARAAYAPRIGGQLRDAAGCAIQACAQPGGGAFPVNEVTGATTPVPERKWWCSGHRHLSAPGDLDPWRARIAFGPGGGIVDLDELDREAADQAREAKRRVDDLEQRRAQRLAQLPEIEAERAAREAMLRRAVLPGAP